jgi:hypothetical protein
MFFKGLTEWLQSTMVTTSVVSSTISTPTQLDNAASRPHSQPAFHSSTASSLLQAVYMDTSGGGVGLENNYLSPHHSAPVVGPQSSFGGVLPGGLDGSAGSGTSLWGTAVPRSEGGDNNSPLDSKLVGYVYELLLSSISLTNLTVYSWPMEDPCSSLCDAHIFYHQYSYTIVKEHQNLIFFNIFEQIITQTIKWRLPYLLVYKSHLFITINLHSYQI